MASYHFSAAPVSRSKGHSVVASSAYRSGENLDDERIGKNFDYTRRSGVMHTEIMAPENTPDWMHDRAQLWNAVEKIEKRKDAQLARNVELSLPHELSHEKRVELLRGFVQEEFVAKGMIADVAVHAPHRDGDQRNYHAHILLTMRTLTGGEFGDKARQWNSKEQLAQWREAWANHTNRMLEREGIEARVDHRSLATQGIDREPELHIGWAASEIARRGGTTDRGNEQDAIHERNAERERLKQELHAVETELSAVQDHAEAANQNEPTAAPETTQGTAQSVSPADRPLSKVVGEIRQAWDDSQSGAGFVAALGERRLSLVVVSAAEAQKSEQDNAAAKAAGGHAPRYREGELVVMNTSGNVYRLTQRTTGAQRDEIDRYLAPIDRAPLLTMEQSRDLARHNKREQLSVKKHDAAAEITQPNRPRGKVAAAIRDAWRLSRNGEGFAAAIEERGLIIAAVSGVEAYKSERVSAFAKEIGNYAPTYREGELVVMNTYGNLYPLNQRTTGAQRHEIDKRLAAMDRTPLLNVTQGLDLTQHRQRVRVTVKQYYLDQETARPRSVPLGGMARTQSNATRRLIAKAKAGDARKADEAEQVEQKRQTHNVQAQGVQAGSGEARAQLMQRDDPEARQQAYKDSLTPGTSAYKERQERIKRLASSTEQQRGNGRDRGGRTR